MVRLEDGTLVDGRIDFAWSDGASVDGRRLQDGSPGEAEGRAVAVIRAGAAKGDGAAGSRDRAGGVRDRWRSDGSFAPSVPPRL